MYISMLNQLEIGKRGLAKTFIKGITVIKSAIIKVCIVFGRSTSIGLFKLLFEQAYGGNFVKLKKRQVALKRAQMQQKVILFMSERVTVLIYFTKQIKDREEAGIFEFKL